VRSTAARPRAVAATSYTSPGHELAAAEIVRCACPCHCSDARQRDAGPIPHADQDIVETWRQEAIQEGVKQGIEQGECAVLLRQLRQRFGNAVDAHVEQRIAMASIEQIDLWTMRILSAATLAEVFAD